MFIFLLVLALLALSRLIIGFYRKSWNKNLSVELSFENNCIFEGGKGKLFQTITNRKLMPFWWGDIQYVMPSFIALDDPDFKGREFFKNTVSAFSYERVRCTLPFTAIKRGYFRINEAELLTQDIFFKYKLIKKYPFATELYVYPNIKKPDNFNIDFKKITGEIISRRHYIEDPFQFRGIRDYYPFDSLKNVNWNASAKTGDIKVNQYNYTSSQEVLLMLDFDSQNNWDRQELKEDIIRIGAYFSSMLLSEGIAVGISSNACDIENADELTLPCKNGANQLTVINRALARVNTDNLSRPFFELLCDKFSKDRLKPQYIIISINHGEALSNKVNEIITSGNSLQWIVVKEKSSQGDMNYQKGLTVCEVSY